MRFNCAAAVQRAVAPPLPDSQAGCARLQHCTIHPFCPSIYTQTSITQQSNQHRNKAARKSTAGHHTCRPLTAMSTCTGEATEAPSLRLLKSTAASAGAADASSRAACLCWVGEEMSMCYIGCRLGSRRATTARPASTTHAALQRRRHGRLCHQIHAPALAATDAAIAFKLLEALQTTVELRARCATAMREEERAASIFVAWIGG